MGWREWVALPSLGIPGIKAKLDTGARTSSLHATQIESFTLEERTMLRFKVHPLRNRTDVVILCETEAIDRRAVMDSGGHSEDRWVIRTPIAFSGDTWSIEITLTERFNMRFRMLLGRTSLRRALLVDPSKSFVTGRSLGNSYETGVEQREEM